MEMILDLAIWLRVWLQADTFSHILKRHSICPRCGILAHTVLYVSDFVFIYLYVYLGGCGTDFMHLRFIKSSITWSVQSWHNLEIFRLEFKAFKSDEPPHIPKQTCPHGFYQKFHCWNSAPALIYLSTWQEDTSKDIKRHSRNIE